MKRTHSFAPLLLVTFLAACGSSDSDTDPVPTPTAGAAGATAGSAGKAGGSGQAGSATGGAGSGGQATGGTSSGGTAGSAAGGKGGTAGQAGGGAGGDSGAAGDAGQGGSAGDAGAGGTDAGSSGAAGDAGQGGTDAGSAGSAGSDAGQGGTPAVGGSAGAAGDGGSGGAVAGAGTAGTGGAPTCGTPAQCAALWEQTTSDSYDLLLDDKQALGDFMSEVPKGGDLHHHLSGSVYAETYLDWAKQDGNCINSSTFAAVTKGQCSASAPPVPSAGTFFDQIVGAWSMEGFVPGAQAQSGHDHFFATFGKFGVIAGARRDDSLADVAARAASENQLYIETMFNLGKNIGDLTTDIWAGSLTTGALSGLYDKVIADSTFATELAKDIKVVNDAASKWRAELGCGGASPPAACQVAVRFVAQIARTGPKDLVFGQMISAFEMASQTDNLVALNLSSPEDDTTSLNNYQLHMDMLDFLYSKYTATKKSPLHVTLHAGELTAKYLPANQTNALTFHIRQAVEKGHAERIGHGLAVLSEDDSAGLLAEMAQRKVMVEVCLSSNVQILEVSGPAHPLGAYLSNSVPVALATDDQGVSRSSLAGEYLRAALDQKLSYRQLKRMARNSLEHAFLPGDSLWSSLDDVDPVSDCVATATMGVGDPANASCQTFLAGSERARMQWELEHRFRVFESKQ